ncbi:MAG: alpha/beta fold hydrolase [Thermaerobacterales bacterium]
MSDAMHLRWQPTTMAGAQSKTLVMGGGEVHYLHAAATANPDPDDRAAKPMILLHGLGAGSGHWLYNIRELARAGPVYALDLPGHGFTRLRIPWQVPHIVGFLEAFMDRLGLAQAVLAGNSLGGAIALYMALCRPERVSHLVLAAPAALGREVHWYLRLMALPGLGYLLSAPWSPALRYWLPFLLVHRPLSFLRGHDRLHAYTNALNQQDNREPIDRILAGQGLLLFGQRNISVVERMGEIKNPTLLAWGEHDRIFPVSQRRRA